MESQTILTIILVIISVNFVLEQILSYLNNTNKPNVLPERLQGIYEQKEYEKSLNYQKTNYRFSLLTSTFSFVLSFILLSTGAFGWFDGILRAEFQDPILLALVFFGILFIASDIINLPFQLYDTFVIEEKFGFNKTTLGTFFKDKIKGYLLSVIIGGLLLSVFLWLVLEIGQNFWIYFWIVTAGFMVFMNMFYATLIVPLFNKLTPLEDGELKEAIQNYCKSVNFPLKNVYVIDGSKRSNKANAFFSGFGKNKKIVLYDTLINNHTTDELVAVLAHEVGHFKKKHIIFSMILSLLQVGFTLFILSLLIFNENLSIALGADQLGIHLNLLAFGILYSPISTITELLMNIKSRKNEFEADAFGATTYDPGSLQLALKKLSVDNLSDLMPHPWYVFFNYSHPPLLERLNAMDRFKSQQNGKVKSAVSGIG